MDVGVPDENVRYTAATILAATTVYNDFRALIFASDPNSRLFQEKWDTVSKRIAALNAVVENDSLGRQAADKYVKQVEAALQDYVAGWSQEDRVGTAKLGISADAEILNAMGACVMSLLTLLQSRTLAAGAKQ